MSTYAFLKDEVRKEADFIETGSSARFKRATVYHDNCGRMYLHLDLMSSLPRDMEPFIEEVTHYEDLFRTEREQGKYRLNEDATAEVTFEVSGDYMDRDYIFRVKVRGKTLEAVRDLFDAIRGGKIRPFESFEAKQGEKPHAELEKELDKTRRELAATREMLVNVLLLADELGKAKWPLCLRATTVAKIRAVAIIPTKEVYEAAAAV